MASSVYRGSISMTGASEMIKLLPCIFYVLLPLCSGFAQMHSVSPISSPRYASGDFDGDGTPEIVVGGRVGPFRAITDPLSTKRARVDLLKLEGNELTVLAIGPELNQVDDVAAGNLDGKLGVEIVAVGAGRLTILGWDGNHLLRLHDEQLPSDQTQRVETIDIDNDGVEELVLTLYDIGDDGDTGVTSLNVYSWNGSLKQLQSLVVRSHVGDIAVVKDAEPRLVLERGTGEEGGEALIIGLKKYQHREIWRGYITNRGQRALNLATMETSGQLVVGATNGSVRLYQITESGLHFRGHGPSLGNAAMLLVHRKQGGISLIGGRVVGSQSVSVSPISF